MNENKILNNLSDKVTLSPDKKRIEIIHAEPARAYGLFDSKTGKQIGDFIDSKNGQVEFNNLDPNKHYDVGVIENKGDEKPEFAMIWTVPMKDDTDNILNNSDNYVIVSDESELNNILNKVDANKFKQFNEDFFINNKLLIVQAGINPEMHKLKIRKSKIDVTIYFATPLMSADQENEYNLYIIPISKDINNYNVERMPYPNREY